MKRKKKSALTVLGLCLGLAACDEPPQVAAQLPGQVDKDKPLVFVLGQGTADPLALDLAGRGMTVVAPPPGQDPAQIVGIKEQVRTALALGLPAERISLIGRGAGRGVTLELAAVVRDPRTPVVLLGGCPAADDEAMIRAPMIKGRVLSLVTGKGGDSCEGLFAAAQGAETWETVIEGLSGPDPFAAPDPAWVDPTLAWLRGG